MQPRRKSALAPALAESRNTLRLWSQLGSLLVALEAASGITPDKALAVWAVESGSLPFVRGRPVLRIECHVLWRTWGHQNAALFNEHFRFGGHNATEGLPWTNHEIRQSGGDWKSLHATQAGEYEAFALVRRLAGAETACLCSSFGGPQVMGFNHAKLGYSDARSLYRAFATSLRLQVLGFFDFCRSENLMSALQAPDWHTFARIYNGPARVNTYAEKINDAWRLALAVTREDWEALAREEEKLAHDHRSFEEFFSGMALKHFSAREFVFRGRDNSAPASPAYGLNRFPPRELWPNIVPLARAVEAFRTQVGAPVTLQSIYRTPAYNSAVGDSADSRHTAFAAVDLTVNGAATPADWLQLMRGIRDRGIFTGAVALEAGVLHIDSRDHNTEP